MPVSCPTDGDALYPTLFYLARKWAVVHFVKCFAEVKVNSLHRISPVHNQAFLVARPGGESRMHTHTQPDSYQATQMLTFPCLLILFHPLQSFSPLPVRCLWRGNQGWKWISGGSPPQPFHSHCNPGFSPLVPKVCAGAWAEEGEMLYLTSKQHRVSGFSGRRTCCSEGRLDPRSEVARMKHAWPRGGGEVGTLVVV